MEARGRCQRCAAWSGVCPSGTVRVKAGGKVRRLQFCTACLARGLEEVLSEHLNEDQRREQVRRWGGG